MFELSKLVMEKYGNHMLMMMVFCSEYRFKMESVFSPSNTLTYSRISIMLRPMETSYLKASASGVNLDAATEKSHGGSNELKKFTQKICTRKYSV